MLDAFRAVNGIDARDVGIDYCGIIFGEPRFAEVRNSAGYEAMLSKVIARAHGGEPLERVAMKTGRRVVYLANPTRIEAVMAGQSNPVGFPTEDVFEFDEDVFAVLADQWARQRATDPATWQRLTPYVIRSSRG